MLEYFNNCSCTILVTVSLSCFAYTLCPTRMQKPLDMQLTTIARSTYFDWRCHEAMKYNISATFQLLFVSHARKFFYICGVTVSMEVCMRTTIDNIEKISYVNIESRKADECCASGKVDEWERLVDRPCRYDFATKQAMHLIIYYYIT